MIKTIDVYYISGNTGLLAKDMGKALLSQFPDISFREESIPFIRNETEARAALEKILQQSGSQHPIVISSLVSHGLNAIFNTTGLHLFTICEQFITRLEILFELNAIRRPGTSRIQDDDTLTSRVNAIHYSIAHDDGTNINDYDDAELIIVGVSRSGKTPVSVFIATQLGVKTANYPLIEKDLSCCHLPAAIRRNRGKVVGLTMDPYILQRFREKRFSDSNYSDLTTCRTELRQAEEIFVKYKVPVVVSGGSSIEETAMQVFRSMKC